MSTIQPIGCAQPEGAAKLNPPASGTLTGVVVNVVGNAVVDAGTECVPAQAAITDAVPPSEVQRPDSPSGCSKLGAPLQSGDA